jgi:two-component SAPR family response regulator
MKKEATMPFIQLLGEEVSLQNTTAKLSSQKGHGFSQYRHSRDRLEIIPQSPPSLIIITPSRLNKGNVIEAAAKIRNITEQIPLAVINNHLDAG